MNILINASNLKAGGGLQVADSVCCQLPRYVEHQFVVVLSNYMAHTKGRLVGSSNVTIVEHNIKNNLSTLLLGRDKVLDRMVKDYNIDAVLTVFGPSRWNPRAPHLSGFAMPHCVLPDSPYFTKMGALQRARWKFKSWLWTFYFWRSASTFWTENPYISKKLAVLLGGSVELTGGGYFFSLDFREKNIALEAGCSIWGRRAAA